MLVKSGGSEYQRSTITPQPMDVRGAVWMRVCGFNILLSHVDLCFPSARQVAESLTNLLSCCFMPQMSRRFCRRHNTPLSSRNLTTSCPVIMTAYDWQPPNKLLAMPTASATTLVKTLQLTVAKHCGAVYNCYTHNACCYPKLLMTETLHLLMLGRETCILHLTAQQAVLGAICSVAFG